MGQWTPKVSFSQSRASPTWSAVRNRLWRAALALTRSRDDAEDLTQQTFATVLARRPEFIDHMGYVRRTMLRLWLDEQRSVRRRLRRIGTVVLTGLAWSRDRDRVSDDERFDAVQRAIATLPVQQHAVVVLRLIEELDYSEIASLLECSVGAVRAHLHLARKKIREVIGDHDEASR